MNNANHRKLIYQYGLITGSIAIAFEIMRFTLKIHYSSEGITTAVTLLILFGGVLIGCLAVKKYNSGFISLSQTLKSGTGNLISCPSICGFNPNSDFLIAASTSETLF